MKLKQILFLVVFFANFFPSVVRGLEIPNNRLLKKPLSVKVAPGRITAIHFESGETIQHFILSDDSRLVYTTDAPIGRSTTFLLRQIQLDPIPGATRTSVPNLLITTRLPDGRTNLYEFLITFEKHIPEQERIIRVVESSYRLEEQEIFSPLGKITLAQVREGLIHVLKTNQANAGDELIQRIQGFLQLAQRLPIDEAIKQSQVDLSIIKRLGQIGANRDGSSFK